MGAHADAQDRSDREQQALRGRSALLAAQDADGAQQQEPGGEAAEEQVHRHLPSPYGEGRVDVRVQLLRRDDLFHRAPQVR